MPAPPEIGWPPILQGPYIHEMPDRALHVTMLPGLGTAMNGFVDQPTFQVRSRGQANDQADAETLALYIDRAIFLQHFPQVVQGVNFLLVARVGGSPAPLGPPEPDSLRYEYTCTYRTVIGN
jgi:hypothetical protein